MKLHNQKDNNTPELQKFLSVVKIEKIEQETSLNDSKTKKVPFIKNLKEFVNLSFLSFQKIF